MIIVNFNNSKFITDRLMNLLDFCFIREGECFHYLAASWMSLSLSFTIVIIQHFFLCQESCYFHNNPKKSN